MHSSQKSLSVRDLHATCPCTPGRASDLTHHASIDQDQARWALSCVDQNIARVQVGLSSESERSIVNRPVTCHSVALCR